MAIYIVYIILILFSAIIYNADKIAVKLKAIKTLLHEVKTNPDIIRDISLGFFINGVFSTINANSYIYFIGYIILTLGAIVGIINANKRITSGNTRNY